VLQVDTARLRAGARHGHGGNGDQGLLQLGGWGRAAGKEEGLQTALGERNREGRALERGGSAGLEAEVTAA
jgi:hypothetical protein